MGGRRSRDRTVSDLSGCSRAIPGSYEHAAKQDRRLRGACGAPAQNSSGRGSGAALCARQLSVTEHANLGAIARGSDAVTVGNNAVASLPALTKLYMALDPTADVSSP